MKKINIIIFAALAVFLVVSCKNNLVSKTEQKAPVPVEWIDVRPGGSTISLVKLTTKRLQAKALPENATDKTLIYSSEPGDIASIDPSGLITAKEVGNASITIKAKNGVSTTINVTVTAEEVPVEDIELLSGLPNKLYIGGEPLNLSNLIKVKPETATDKGLIYTTDNNSVNVSEDGTVTAQSPGTVNITVKSKSNPGITETVTLTIKQKPEIELNIKDVASNSDEEHPTFTVKTLHDKLEYTPEVVGDGKEWLSFDHTDSTSSTTEDTIYLKAKLNKTVWDRVAYIKFKDANGRYIKGADGKELEVTFTQKKNEHPNVTIKWVYGIGEPTQAEKEDGKIEIPRTNPVKYWDNSYIFFWYETDKTKWFNNRKLLNLGVTADNNADDSNQCWGKTASNMLHWWFIQNKKNIDRYIEKKNITGTEKDKYQDFYTRGLPDNKEKEKSYIATIFRTKAHNNKLGDYIIGGLSWYLYGNKAGKISKQEGKGENQKPLFDDPALFKDVFDKSESKTPLKAEGIYNKADFNRAITEALDSKKAIGINIEGSRGNGLAYGHAITLWGAAFDEEGNIITIYVVNNNYKENRIYPYGIWYKDGRPYLFNYPNNARDEHKYVGQVTTLDIGEKQWKEWFDAHP